MTRLRLGLSHIQFQKFKNSSLGTLNPICSCATLERAIHYLPPCPHFSNEQLTLYNKLQSIDENTLSKDESKILKMLFFGDDSFNYAKINSVLTASIKYILSKKHFDVPLYQNWHLSISLYAVYF